MDTAWVRRGCRAGVTLAAQLAALGALSWLAHLLAKLSPVPIPAGAIGMALLFALLAFGVVKLAWIEPCAGLLVRHLGLFLIPHAVSAIELGTTLRSGGIALLCVLIASTLIGMAAAGWSAQAARLGSELHARRYARRQS